MYKIKSKESSDNRLVTSTVNSSQLNPLARARPMYAGGLQTTNHDIE